MKRIFCILLLLLALSLLACEHAATDPPETDGTDHTDHRFDATVVPPSCTRGYVIYTCRDCGYSYTDNYVDAIGHRFTTVLEDANCDRMREYRHVCEVCQFSYTEASDLPGTRHQMQKVQVVPPTSSERGYTVYGCVRCTHEELSDYTSPTNHSMGLDYTDYSYGCFVSGLGTCTDTEIIIPSVNEHGQTVVGIAEKAFLNATHLISISVPDTVRTIRRSAFAGCSSLQRAVLPPKARVEEGIFWQCNHLVELTMPLQLNLSDYFSFDVSSAHTAIPRTLKTLHIVGSLHELANVRYAAELTTVTVAEGITTIPNYFAWNCSKLSEFSCPSTVTSIGSYAFDGTALREFVLPRGVTTIQSYTFSDCRQLKRVVLHDQLRRIDEMAFMYCNNLTTLDLPDSLNYLQSYAFAQSGLTQIRIPESVVILPESVFSNCKSLSKIELHDGIVTIGQNAFYGTAITSFTFPANVQGDVHALSGCKNLTEVHFNGNVSTVGGFDGCSSLRSITLPDSTTKIDREAFSGCTMLTDIRIPDTVRSIGEMAFMNCASLQSIVLPDTVTELGKQTFSGCTSLRSVTLPKALGKLGANAFAKCSSLQSISLPESLTEIGERTFEASGLCSIELPAGVKLAGGWVFADCTKLTDVTLGCNPTQFCFEDCTDLQALTLTEGVTAIGWSAFLRCQSLETVKLPDSLQRIDKQAFQDCTTLPRITLPLNLREVGEDAFRNCNALAELNLLSADCSVQDAFSSVTRLNVGEGVRRIPPRMLQGAEIESLVLPSTLTEIGASAFQDCKKLTQVTLPASLKELGASAFSGSAIIELRFSGETLRLGGKCFADCKQLRTVDLGGAAVTFQSSEFSGCDALEQIKLDPKNEITDATVFPERFYQIENSLIICFSTLVDINDAEIESTVVVPDGIRYIAAEAFRDCAVIKSVTFPASLQAIRDYAFAGCTRLRRIELPTSVHSLGVGVFSGCPLLEEVILPDALEELPSRALADCGALKSLSLGTKLRSIAPDCYSVSAATGANQSPRALYTLHYRGSAEEWTAIALGEKNLLASCTVLCTDKTLIGILEERSIYGTPFSLIVYSDFTMVLSGSGAFTENLPLYSSYVDQVKKLVISEGITSFSAFGLERLTQLETLELPASLLSLSVEELSHTPWYQNLQTENGLFIVNNRLYYASRELRGAITLPEGLISIGDSTFSGCDHVTEIHVSSGVTEIGVLAFAYCDTLRTVTLPEGLISIGDRAFADCAVLQNVTLPQSLRKLGYNLFSGCDAITEITVPAGVTDLQLLASSCDSLRRVTVHCPVTGSLFGIYYCDALEYVILGEGTVTLPSNAVYGCPSLKAIVIPSTLTDPDPMSFDLGANTLLCFVSADNAQAVLDVLNSRRPEPLVAYFYSKTPPTSDGNWWHYNENEDPVAY